MSQSQQPTPSVEYTHGLPADLLSWPVPPEVDYVVLFIPGNPGLPSYYTNFLSTLLSAVPSTAIYALGHLGHSPAHAPVAFTASSAASLDDQIAHKVAFVDRLVQKHGVGREEGQPRLILIGHSIGSYICLKALQSRPHTISSLHLLFPTVSHMSSTPNGLRLFPLFTTHLFPPIALTTYLLSFLPRPLLTPIVSLLSKQSGPSAHITSSLVASPGTVLAALGMARDEMRQVKALDNELVREFSGRCWWYWADGDDDGWVRQSSIREIEEVLDQVGAGAGRERRFRCTEGMQHAFVLNEEHSTALAERCAGWILEEHGV